MDFFLVTRYLIFMKRSFLLGAVLLNIPAGGAQDMLNMTSVPPEISNSEADHTFQRSCTNPSGRIIPQGQAGYQECLELARNKKAKPSDNGDSKIIVQPQ
jgi:hypothetical protein